MVSHPRILQYRRLARCVAFAAAAVVTAAAALGALAGGLALVGIVLLAVAAGFATAS